MADVIRMDAEKTRRVRKRVRALCANCDGGNCLLLDDGESCVCPQLITASLVCKYFRTVVLPADRELRDALLRPRTFRSCRQCGKPFAPPKHNTLYCLDCAVLRTKQNKRKWADKYRANL